MDSNLITFFRRYSVKVGVGVYFGDPDGNALALSCQDGYPPDGLDRNTGRSWAPAPFAWTGATASLARSVPPRST